MIIQNYAAWQQKHASSLFEVGIHDHFLLGEAALLTSWCFFVRLTRAVSSSRPDVSKASRAAAVKDGVPKGALAIQGFGETHLPVPTGPGVREPQNRRVEIIIR
jgi:hypothetical protein